MTLKRALYICRRLTRKDIACLAKALVIDLAKLCIGVFITIVVLGLPELLADIACFFMGV